MAVIMVGAMIVASIETVWAGLVTPPKDSCMKLITGKNRAEQG